MLVLNFDKNNYVNLGKLISQGKKVFLLCYVNNKSNIDIVNEWVLLQVLQKYILNDDVILAKLLVNTKIQLLKRFPRIYRTGRELPRIVYVDGLTSVTKYTGMFLAKNIIDWIKKTLNITMDILAQEKSEAIAVRSPRVINHNLVSAISKNKVNDELVEEEENDNDEEDENENDDDEEDDDDADEEDNDNNDDEENIVINISD
jgi:hypothetical protein